MSSGVTELSPDNAPEQQRGGGVTGCNHYCTTHQTGLGPGAGPPVGTVQRGFMRQALIGYGAASTGWGGRLRQGSGQNKQGVWGGPAGSGAPCIH